MSTVYGSGRPTLHSLLMIVAMLIVSGIVVSCAAALVALIWLLMPTMWMTTTMA